MDRWQSESHSPSGILPRAIPLLSGQLKGLLFLTISAAASGCSDQEQELTTTVSDSSGVVIWTYRELPDSKDLIWRIDSEPLVSIGVQDGDDPYLFSRIVGGFSLGEGYLVAEGTTGEFRLFDSSGEHLRSVGRSGSGPGEYEMLRWTAKIGADFVLAWDLRTRRLTILDPSLNFQTTESLNPGSTYVVAGAFEDGDLLLWPFGPMREEYGTARVLADSIALAVPHPTAQSLDTILRLPARPVFNVPDGPMVRLPFSAEPGFAVQGQTVWAGNGSTGEFFRSRKDGEVSLIVRLPTGRPVTPEDETDYKDRDLAHFTEAELPERRGLLRQLPFPETFPAFDRLQAGSNGEVWVRRYPDPTQDSHDWLIFDGSGQLIGRTSLPANADILEVPDDRVVCLVRDSLGVQRIVVYRYARSTESDDRS